MKTLTLNPGDKAELKTKDKTWTGHILESHDSEVILLKLKSGYNIGIRESEILHAKVLEKSKETKKEKISLTQKKTLPNIAMIVTGGTISARLDPKTGGTTWTTVDDLFKIAPEIQDICNITKIERPFLIASEDMEFNHYKKIAQLAEKLLNNPDIHGLIITHGTDFLHYTAEAIAFSLRNLNKPVAVTYSQRSIDRGSTDAHLNLICAAKYAISDIAEVALIGHKDLNDQACLAMPATKTRKMHTSRRDAFQVINDEPIAEITKKELKILKNFNARNNKKVKLEASFNPNVALITIYPGQDPAILDFYKQQGYKGIILELSGLGHVSTSAGKYNWIAKIQKLIKRGMIICGAPQTIYGSLNPKVYSAGRELEKTGLIFLKDMLAETAFVKLGWVLGHKEWKGKEKEKMLENFAGEFNDRLSN